MIAGSHAEVSTTSRVLFPSLLLFSEPAAIPASPIVLSRWRAASLQLLVSAVVAGSVLGLALGAWYPMPLFFAEGGSRLVSVVVAVDLVVGPLLTFIIYRAGKPGLRTDLAVVTALRTGALLFGMYVMFMARPVFIVFIDNQFVTVRANDLDAARMAQANLAQFRSLPVTGPLYVGVEMPKDWKELGQVIEYTFKTNTPVTELPKYYVPYARQQQQAQKTGRPLDAALKDTDEFAIQVQKAVAASGRAPSELRFLPLQTRQGWGAVIIDAANGAIVALVPPVP